MPKKGIKILIKRSLKIPNYNKDRNLEMRALNPGRIGHKPLNLDIRTSNSQTSNSLV